MAINWTEAQIEEVINAVIKSLNGGAPAAKTGYDGSQYNGRRYIGVYTDMNEAIEAATAGYKAVRAMSLEEREKVISEWINHVIELFEEADEKGLLSERFYEKKAG